MYHYHTLSNGLRIVFRPTTSTVAYSGVYINVGSRDEAPADEGMAHFIEHSIFKGTEHRRSYHILNRIDGVGGELNAFTTKEETCIYASSLAEHLERCLELFSDVLFHSVFPSHEIENEKDVVVEEINSYRDQPAELIYDEFEELFFRGHPLSHNILGTKRNVKGFTPARLRDFMRANYTPSRMVVTVVANVDFRKLVRLCEKYFGSYQSSESPSPRLQSPVSQCFDMTVNRHTHQVHLMVGCPAPNLFDERKVAFTLLNNIIGGPAMNSRLNVAIRERYGFCYTIESQYIPYSDAGLFNVYAGVDGDAAERTTELILRELRAFCSQPLTPHQLLAAQKQLIAQMSINNDVALNEMQSIGKAYLNYDHVDTLEEMSRDLLSVTSSDIQNLANELFASDDSFSFLYYK